MLDRDSAESRAKELVYLLMEDLLGRPFHSPAMPRYVAEQVVAYVGPRAEYDGTKIKSLKIIPLGIVEVG